MSDLSPPPRPAAHPPVHATPAAPAPSSMIPPPSSADRTFHRLLDEFVVPDSSPCRRLVGVTVAGLGRVAVAPELAVAVSAATPNGTSPTRRPAGRAPALFAPSPGPSAAPTASASASALASASASRSPPASGSAPTPVSGSTSTAATSLPGPSSSQASSQPPPSSYSIRPSNPLPALMNRPGARAPLLPFAAAANEPRVSSPSEPSASLLETKSSVPTDSGSATSKPTSPSDSAAALPPTVPVPEPELPQHLAHHAPALVALVQRVRKASQPTPKEKASTSAPLQWPDAPDGPWHATKPQLSRDSGSASRAAALSTATAALLEKKLEPTQPRAKSDVDPDKSVALERWLAEPSDSDDEEPDPIASVSIVDQSFKEEGEWLHLSPSLGDRDPNAAFGSSGTMASAPDMSRAGSHMASALDPVIKSTHPMVRRALSQRAWKGHRSSLPPTSISFTPPISNGWFNPTSAAAAAAALTGGPSAGFVPPPPDYPWPAEDQGIDMVKAQDGVFNVPVLPPGLLLQLAEMQGTNTPPETLALLQQAATANPEPLSYQPPGMPSIPQVNLPPTDPHEKSKGKGKGKQKRKRQSAPDQLGGSDSLTVPSHKSSKRRKTSTGVQPSSNESARLSISPEELQLPPVSAPRRPGRPRKNPPRAKSATPVDQGTVSAPMSRQKSLACSSQGPRSTPAPSDPNPAPCFCGLGTDGGPEVQCESCKRVYHKPCVGYRAPKSKKEWVCHACTVRLAAATPTPSLDDSELADEASAPPTEAPPVRRPHGRPRTKNLPKPARTTSQSKAASRNVTPVPTMEATGSSMHDEDMPDPPNMGNAVAPFSGDPRMLALGSSDPSLQATLVSGSGSSQGKTALSTDPTPVLSHGDNAQRTPPAQRGPSRARAQRYGMRAVDPGSPLARKSLPGAMLSSPGPGPGPRATQPLKSLLSDPALITPRQRTKASEVDENEEDQDPDAGLLVRGPRSDAPHVGPGLSLELPLSLSARALRMRALASPSAGRKAGPGFWAESPGQMAGLDSGLNAGTTAHAAEGSAWSHASRPGARFATPRLNSTPQKSQHDVPSTPPPRHEDGHASPSPRPPELLSTPSRLDTPMGMAGRDFGLDMETPGGAFTTPRGFPSFGATPTGLGGTPNIGATPGGRIGAATPRSLGLGTGLGVNFGFSGLSMGMGWYAGGNTATPANSGTPREAGWSMPSLISTGRQAVPATGPTPHVATPPPLHQADPTAAGPNDTAGVPTTQQPTGPNPRAWYAASPSSTRKQKHNLVPYSSSPHARSPAQRRAVRTEAGRLSPQPE